MRASGPVKVSRKRREQAVLRNAELSAEISAHVGSTLLRVQRVSYELRGDITIEEGDVQLELERGIVRLRSAPAGNALVLETTGWIDPFVGHMTPENVEYVAECGKHALVDVSGESGYRDLVGRALLGFACAQGPDGVESVILRFESGSLRVRISGDEVYVDFALGEGGAADSWRPAHPGGSGDA
jgi:hypothetical protein